MKFIAKLILSISILSLILLILNFSFTGFSVFHTLDTYTEETFVTVWKTDNVGDSNDNQITLPLTNTGTHEYNFTVDWGDESTSIITSSDSTNKTHTYDAAGTYQVQINGTIVEFNFGSTYSDSGDKLKLLEIKQWGCLNLGDNFYGGYFKGTSNLNISATDILNLTGTTTLRYAFSQSGITYIPSINNWNISGITDMEGMFYYASDFNSNLSGWDVSNVIDMHSIFRGASSLTSDLSSWDTSKVTDMGYMFSEASSFTSDLSSWNTSKVIDMNHMFSGVSNFNSDLSSWDIGKVIATSSMFLRTPNFNSDLNNWNISSITSMGGMFSGASSFNSDLSGWDVSDVLYMDSLFQNNSYNGNISSWDVGNVIRMNDMFSKNIYFDGDISSWDVGNVTSMSGMFSNSNFNGNLSSWNTSKVTSISSMFKGASSFNSDLSSWDVSNVVITEYMFENASSFNSDLSSWNVSKVHTMNNMFLNASNFTSNLSSWDVSNVLYMYNMFANASNFNSDLSSWNVSSVQLFYDFLKGTNFSTENYDKLLNEWSLLPSLLSGKTFSVGDTTYCHKETERTNIIDTYSWSITDGGLDPSCAPPEIELTFPQNNEQILQEDIDFIINISSYRELKNITFYLWNSTGTLINETDINISGTFNTSNISISLPYFGNFSSNYYYCDELDFCDINDENFTNLYYSSALLIEILTPVSGISSVNVTNNTFFEISVNVTCKSDDCGEINVSLDPIQGCNPSGEDCTSACSDLMDIDYMIENDFLGDPWHVEEYDDSYGCVDNQQDISIMDDVECDSYSAGGDGDGDCILIYVYFEGSNDFDFLCPSSERNSNSPVTADDCDCDLGDCTGHTPPLNFDNIFFSGSAGKDGLIPFGDGTPFYTNVTNPYTVNLNEDESEIVTWYVNATGDINSTNEFFVFTTLLKYPLVEEETNHWDVTISDIEASPVILNISSEYYGCEGAEFSTDFQVIDYDGNLSIVDSLPRDLFFARMVSDDRSPIFDIELFSNNNMSKEDVGNHTRNISAIDNLDFENSAEVTFKILEINEIPSTEDMGVFKIWINNSNSTFSETFNVSDVEDGLSSDGNLTFNLSFANGDSFSLFNIDENGSMLYEADQFSPLEVYSLKVCVEDNPLLDLHENITELCGSNGSSNMVCDEFALTISNESRTPEITSFSPTETNIEMVGGTTSSFNINIFDGDGDALSVKLFVDEVEKDSETVLKDSEYNYFNEFNYSFGCGIGGQHNISILVDDGLLNSSTDWDVTLQNVACPVDSSSSSSSGSSSGYFEPYSNNNTCTNWNNCQNIDDSFDHEIISLNDYNSYKEQCNQLKYLDNTCGYQTRECINNTIGYKETKVCYFITNPRCNDGVKNCHDGFCETGIDCGGECDACPTCHDGKKNQGEAGIDCDGPCPDVCDLESPDVANSIFITLTVILSLTVGFIIFKMIVIFRKRGMISKSVTKKKTSAKKTVAKKKKYN